MDNESKPDLGRGALEVGVLDATQADHAESECVTSPDGSLAEPPSPPALIPGADRTLQEPSEPPTQAAEFGAERPAALPQGDSSPVHALWDKSAGDSFPTLPIPGHRAASSVDPDAETMMWHSGSGEALPPGSNLPARPERYRPIRLYARGGIGQIWLARDCHLGREVAVKELRPKRAGDPRTAARFLEEARIAGQLEHPGIVPVYDLAEGDQEQRPFYTMRFVRGRNMSQSIKEYHQARQEGRAGPLQLRALIQALVAACQAVAYAHSRGVIHRDLKPHNMVLGDFGEVMLLDWGLAKVVKEGPKASDLDPERCDNLVALDPDAAHDETRIGETIGTPAYMSPEQASGRLEAVGPPSDIYGLGTILYEILAGRPPYIGETTKQLLRQVREGPPDPPSEFCPRVHPALEAICRKAMAREPSGRYGSAAELAEDLERWLADEPVKAWREPLSLACERWVRHHLVVLGAAGLLLLTITAALFAGDVLISRQKVAADLARNQAESDVRFTRYAINQMLTRVADQRLARVPQMLKVREDLVEDALRAYGNLMKSRPTDATVPLEMARVYQTAGNIYRLGNKFEKARAQFEVARRLVDNLGAGNPKNPEYRELTGELLRENAVLEWTMGRPADAVPLARSALDIALALRADFPKELPYERMEARLRSLVGLLAREFGRYGEALAELDKSIELWKQLADGPAVGPTDGVELVIALDGRGAALIETNRTVEAAEVLRQAINRSRVLLLRAPDDPDRRSVLASALTNLGRVLATDPAKSTEATKALDEAVDLSKNLVIDFPEVVQNRASLAEKLEARATLDTQESREPAAQQDVQEATRLLDRLLQQFPDASDYNELLARTLVDQAILARKAGRSGEVPGLLDRAKLCLERARKANPEGLLIKRTWATYQAERARIAEPGAPSRLKP